MSIFGVALVTLVALIAFVALVSLVLPQHCLTCAWCFTSPQTCLRLPLWNRRSCHCHHHRHHSHIYWAEATNQILLLSFLSIFGVTFASLVLPGGAFAVPVLLVIFVGALAILVLVHLWCCSCRPYFPCLTSPSHSLTCASCFTSHNQSTSPLFGIQDLTIVTIYISFPSPQHP